MDFTTLTIELLGKLASVVGNYGWAIIVLTIIVRLCLWPLNVSKTLNAYDANASTEIKSDPRPLQKQPASDAAKAYGIL